jgi:hypothetical protein
MIFRNGEIMKLSNDTLGVLKNFSAINSNLVIQPGNKIKTISEAKNILATASVKEAFEVGFGIYDLNEFLGVVGMFDDPELSVNDDQSSATIKQDRRSVKYFFSDPSILTSPAKDIQLPSVDVTFSLSQDDMNALRKASSALGLTDVVVVGEEGGTNAVIKVTDERDTTANSFSLDLTDVTRPEEAFKVVFNIGNFKFVNGDYHVEISSKLISHFKNTTTPVEYWVALEKTSKFGG